MEGWGGAWCECLGGVRQCMQERVALCATCHALSVGVQRLNWAQQQQDGGNEETIP